MGWGGVGMMTFLAHEDIFDATEKWGGVGWCGEDDVPNTKEFKFSLLQHCHSRPGRMSVLNALQLYRNDCSRGKICVAPKDAFDPDSLSWLA